MNDITILDTIVEYQANQDSKFVALETILNHNDKNKRTEVFGILSQLITIGAVEMQSQTGPGRYMYTVSNGNLSDEQGLLKIDRGRILQWFNKQLLTS